MTALVVQYWNEHERGWGSRSDGVSLHLTTDDQKRFIADYWASMPYAVPDEYSAPDGRVEIKDAPEHIVENVRKSKNGLRYHKLPW